MSEAPVASSAWSRWVRRRWVLALVVLVVLSGLTIWIARQFWAKHQFHAARAALVRHDLDEAWARLERCLRVWPEDPEVLLWAGRTARRLGHFQPAVEYLQACRDLGHVDPRLDLEFVLLAAQQGDLRPEVEGPLLAIASQAGPSTRLALEALSLGYLCRYRLGEACRCVDDLLAIDPDHAPALLCRGYLQESKWQFAEATESYRRILELLPGHSNARLRLGEVLLNLKQTSEAAQHFTHLLSKQPRLTSARLGLARCHRLLGQAEQARSVLLELLDEKTEEKMVLCELGQVALAASEPAAAEKYLRQALVLDANDMEICFALARALQALGRDSEAKLFQTRSTRIETDLNLLRALHQKIGEDPANPQLRCEAGLICLRNGQDKEAVRWLTGALQIEPNHFKTHQVLAEHYEKAGQKDLAAKHRHMQKRE